MYLNKHGEKIKNRARCLFRFAAAIVNVDIECLIKRMDSKKAAEIVFLYELECISIKTLDCKPAV